MDNRRPAAAGFALAQIATRTPASGIMVNMVESGRGGAARGGQQ